MRQGLSTRTLLYCRQSVEHEGGERSLSIDSQVTALTDRCQREGWTVVGVIREAGLKGWMDADERPGLAEAIDRAQAGDYRRLLVWDLSRLARSVRLQEQWVWQFDRLGISVVSHTEPHVADALIRQITGAVNEHRTREIAGHVRRALRERTRRGIPHGSTPFGYVRDETGILVPDERAPIVRRIFLWRAEGRSLGEIADDLRRQHVPGPTGGVWFRTTLTYLLENPVYRGASHLAEIEVEGTHEAIISPELWQRAQDVSGSRPRSPRTKAARSWLEGLIEHACGHPMYLTGGSPGRPTLVFRCRAGAGWAHPDATCAIQPRQLRAEYAETLAWEAVMQALDRLPTSARRVVAEAQRQFRQSVPAAEAAIRDATVRQNRARLRRERVLEAYLSGDIDRARFDRETAAIDAELREAESLLARLPQPPNAEAIEAAWQALRQMRRIVAGMEDTERRRVLHRLGIAVVSPAGVTMARNGPGQRADAGRVVIRFREEYREFFAEQRRQ